ncbi:prephenate dehydrogenase [Corynebacterium breve]|uniref:Prephenate dehydrogenase n=1 Tax=Corynebacterium breve TaxID=3049799 RepID=A0ABY8VE05_9CORY|nr:prephenate dehydrogenase [Corynebacterium breve]WIM67890.1 prephenate dehydrogenase [Corynebacterium breve]
MSSRDVSRPICIIGLGLIGGSLMRDLVRHKQTVYGYNRSTSGTRAAVKEGFDVSDNLVATLQRAESDGAVLVIAVPMQAVASVLDAIAEHAPNCGMTDVVSVKKPVYDLVRERGMESRYVGGHPMAGTEFSGWSASKEQLFVRAAWVITYDYARDLEVDGLAIPAEWVSLFIDVCRMVAVTRAEAIPVSVRAHDEAVGRVSHLPHVIAEALSIVGDNGGTLAQSLAAGSFKDATRVAGTAPELVRAMCETNAAALVYSLDEMIKLLTQARNNLDTDNPNIEALVDAGHRAHTRLEARSGARRESVSPVKISSRPVMRLHPGGKGWVRQLVQAESLGGRIEVF